MLKIVRRMGAWGPVKEEVKVPLIDGGTVWDYLPEDFKSLDVVLISLNGNSLFDEQIKSIIPQDGDRLVIAPYAGIVLNLILLVVGIAINVGLWAFNQHEARSLKENRRHARVGDTYSFDVMTNNFRDGARLPVIYGEHRFAGQVITLYTEQFTEGVDEINYLIALGEGPIEAINPNGDATDLHIDGNSSANHPNLQVTKRIGTLNDASIPGFDKVVTTTAYNAQLSPGGTVIVSGTVASDSFRVKMQFISGMYHIDRKGRFHSTLFAVRYRYRTTAGPGAWSSWIAPTGQPFNTTYPGEFYRRRTTPFSIFWGANFPSKDTYDVEFDRFGSDGGHDNNRTFCDSYVKEYQEVANDDLIYPAVAKIAVEFIANAQLSGRTPRITNLIRGRKVMELASASSVTLPAWSRNNADVILDLIYSWRYGTASRWDTRLRLTMTGISGGPYTVGEEVRGPVDAGDYQFRGMVREESGNFLLVESIQGTPYGVLTGQSSGATGTVSSIDEAHAVDLASLWDFKQFCNEYVPNGSGIFATVDQDSASGQPDLYVDNPTNFSANEYVVVDFEGSKQETLQIKIIHADRLEMWTNLQFAHTLAEAHRVDWAEVRSQFDFVFNGPNLNAKQAIEMVANRGRAMVVWEPQIRIVPLRLETPGPLICRGNTGVKSFAVSYSPGPKNRPNRMDGHYLDRTLDFRKMLVRIDAPEIEINDEEIIPAEREYYGITRQSEVSRLAWFNLKRMRYISKTIQLVLGTDHFDLQVGDVRWVQNDVPGIGIDGGRIVQVIDSTTVRLDRPVVLPSGTHFIRIQAKDQTQASYQITNPAGTHRDITVSTTLSPTPAEWDLWAVGELGRYRCIGLTPTQDGDAEVQFEEDSEGYYSEDFGVTPEFTPSTLADPDELPPDVEDVELSEAVGRKKGGQLRNLIDVSFRKPILSTQYAKAEIYLNEKTGAVKDWGKENFSPGQGTAPVEFFRPVGVWAGDIGTDHIVIVADQANQRVLVINAATEAVLHTFGTVGTKGDSSTLFRDPGDVCADQNYIYILDTGNHKIKVYNATTYAWVSTFGSKGSATSQFLFPSGITTDGTNIWVADTQNDRGQKFTETAGVLSFVSAFGTTGSGNGDFINPFGISAGGTYVYFADTGNDRVQYFNKSTDAYVGQFGTSGDQPGEFDRPVDVAVNTVETVITVADLRNQRLSTWNGSYIHQFDVGSWGNGRDEFKVPRGVSNDNGLKGIVYVADSNNNRVQGRDQSELGPDSWEFMGETTDQDFRISQDLAPGEPYEVAVVSVSPRNIKKDPGDAPSAEITLTASGGRPPDVANLYAANKGPQVRLYWDPVVAVDLKGYKIKGGTDWATAQPIAEVGKDDVEYLVGQSIIGKTGNSKYLIKAVTTSDLESTTAATVTHSHPAVGILANTPRVFLPVNQRTS